MDSSVRFGPRYQYTNAEAGGFTEASKTVKLGIEMATAKIDTMTVELLEERMDIYKKGNSFRETTN